MLRAIESLEGLEQWRGVVPPAVTAVWSGLDREAEEKPASL